MSEAIWNVAQTLGMGMFGSNSHPIHPATVHFPVTLLPLSYALDLLYGFTATGNPLLTAFHPHLLDIAKASYYANILGMISSIPSLITGDIEMIAMIKGKGLFERIEKKNARGERVVVSKGTNPTVREGVIHGALNAGALMVSLYNWYTRRHVRGFEPSTTNIILSGLTLPLMMFSAYLGGSLVYKHGVAVQRQGEAAQIKKDTEKDEFKGYEGQTMVKERKDQ